MCVSSSVISLFQVLGFGASPTFGSFDGWYDCLLTFQLFFQPSFPSFNRKVCDPLSDNMLAVDWFRSSRCHGSGVHAVQQDVDLLLVC